MNSPKKPTATDKSNGLLRGNVFFSFSFFFLSFLFPFFPRHDINRGTRILRLVSTPISRLSRMTWLTWRPASLQLNRPARYPQGRHETPDIHTGARHRYACVRVCVRACVERGGGGWHERCNSLWRRGGASGATQLSINIFTAV